jgi:O-methyltransferase involved in polyketide biosynthesis
MFNSKISKTSLWLPGLRAIEGVDSPHSKEIYEALAKELGEDINPNSAVAADPILNTALMGRYRKISDMVSQSGVKNIIEVACGFSARGITTANNDPTVQCVDSDLPDVIAMRKNLVPHLQNSRHKNYSMLGGDAFDRKTFENAARIITSNPECDGKIMVVSEGLLRYHPEEQQDKLAENINWLKSEFDEVRWITDCVRKADTSKAPGCAAYNKTAGIPDDYCFPTEQHLVDFMKRHGFKYSVTDWSSVGKDLVHAKSNNYGEKDIADINKLHVGTHIAEAESIK